MTPKRLVSLSRIVQPLIVGTAIATSVVMSLVQIRRRNRRRARWVVPVIVISALVLIGLFAAVVERVVTTLPDAACGNGSYVAQNGQKTCRPVFSSSVPDGATARCTDGTYSFDRDDSSVCSRHGGVEARLL